MISSNKWDCRRADAIAPTSPPTSNAPHTSSGPPSRLAPDDFHVLGTTTLHDRIHVRRPEAERVGRDTDAANTRVWVITAMAQRPGPQRGAVREQGGYPKQRPNDP